MILGYTRVSTHEQADEGVSLTMQAAKIHAYCSVKDWVCDLIIEDGGHSAKDLDRPGMQTLLGMLECNDVSAVVVCKLDRLTRSVVDLNTLVKLFDRQGVALVSIVESLDATSATGRLMMNLLMSVSQWEREVIGERTRDALGELKAQGKAYCRPVFADTELRERMRKMRSQGYTYHAIAHELNTAGVNTARGGTWHASTVRQIVQQLYTGKGKHHA